ncbi:MAG: GDP-mannose 4,6-dehydratase, partial [Paludibacter sp.]
AKIALGMQKKLYLGNLSSKRDWGHAKDYVDAMWRVLQYEKAEDFVISTGITTEVREFVRLAFNEVGIDLEFRGEGINEKAYIVSCKNSEFQLEIGEEVVAIDPYYFRPTEVDLLLGDSTKARTLLGWVPKYSIADLVKEMVESDIHFFKGEKLLRDNGYRLNNYI